MTAVDEPPAPAEPETEREEDPEPETGSEETPLTFGDWVDRGMYP